MTWIDSFPDLLTICGGAPDGGGAPTISRTLRGQAARLLGTELIARLDLTDRDHNPPLRRVPGIGEETEDLAAIPSHFAWRDLQSEDPSGGERRAQMYMRWGMSSRHHFPGVGTVPKTPGTQGAYDLTLVAILIQGATVYLAAIAEIGGSAFATARATYTDWLEAHYPDAYPGDS